MRGQLIGDVELRSNSTGPLKKQSNQTNIKQTNKQANKHISENYSYAHIIVIFMK